MKGVKLQDLIDAGATVGPPVRLPESFLPAGTAHVCPDDFNLSDYLQQVLGLAGVVGWVVEYPFAPPRRWRFDLAWVADRVAVECEGGIDRPGGGAHNSPDAFRKDVEKYNRAALDGWLLLRVTGAMIRSGEALNLIVEALRGRKGVP